MGCKNCGSGGGSCGTGGSCGGKCGSGNGKVYNWLGDIVLPSAISSTNIIEVKFKGSRKEFYENTSNLYIEMGELIVVEGSQGGFDVGHVSLCGELVERQLLKKKVKDTSAVKKVLRKPTPADIDRWVIAKQLEYETMHKARTLAIEQGLKMKISDVDYQGDKSKATFYYTADDRVDFRELIKRMAEVFKIRIEMRQIGMRQEVSRLGGIGSCGRELCCSSWLTDFKTVSTAAARYQNLSLNPLKLAGQCGKLKCCLNYELETYLDAIKDIPENITMLKTEKGNARLVKTDIFKRIMWFSYPDSSEWIPISVDKVIEINKLNGKDVVISDLKQFEKTNKAVSDIEEKKYDYENVIGQDSLTRLDDSNKKKKKKKKTNNFKKVINPDLSTNAQTVFTSTKNDINGVKPSDVIKERSAIKVTVPNKKPVAPKPPALETDRNVNNNIATGQPARVKPFKGNNKAIQNSKHDTARFSTGKKNNKTGNSSNDNNE